MRRPVHRAFRAWICFFICTWLCFGSSWAGEVEFGFPDQVAGWTFHPYDVQAADIKGDGTMDVATAFALREIGMA